MTTQIYDAIIIGQGLAGSLLAWQFYRSAKKVLIVDPDEAQSASKVAAGIINPITGPRLVKQNNADLLLAQADQVYHELQTYFKVNFYQERNYKRIFQSDEEINYWQLRHNDPDYDAYLNTANTNVQIPPETRLFIDKYGCVHQKQVKQLNTNKLLNCLHDFFKSKQLLITEKLAYDDITIQNKHVFVGHFETKTLIFCEGYQAINNPWFSWLPFVSAKGEILTMHSDLKLDSQIVSFGHWFMPISEHRFQFGSNYEWNTLNPIPSKDGKKYLLQRLHKSLTSKYAKQFPFYVLQHQAGIRPCSKDRSPFIGKHPNVTQLYIFNGFGAKGGLLIPYFANRVIENLYKNVELDKKVDITRYWPE